MTQCAIPSFSQSFQQHAMAFSEFSLLQFTDEGWCGWKLVHGGTWTYQKNILTSYNYDKVKNELLAWISQTVQPT